MTQQYIEDVGVWYDEAVKSQGKTQVIARGAFDASLRNNKVGLWLNHAQIVCDSVETYSDNKRGALCFRVELPDDTDIGKLARHMIKAEHGVCGVSIGFENLGRVNQWLDIIKEARLDEISLTYKPCQNRTFARLCTPTQSIAEVCDNGQLYADGAFDQMIRTFRKINDRTFLY